MKLPHKRAMAALSAVTVAAVLVAGCSSPAKPAPPPPPTGLLRLGYTATLADVRGDAIEVSFGFTPLRVALGMEAYFLARATSIEVRPGAFGREWIR